MSYWEIQKLNGFAVNPYQYSSNPVAQAQVENPWVTYFNRSNNSQQQSQVSTSEAISQLNAMHEQEQVNGGKKLSPEEAKEVKKKADAQKKLAKLSKQLQNDKEIAVTQKHIDALNMIQDCTPLMSLNDTLMQKIKGVISQNIFLIQKVANAEMQSKLSASEISSLINEVSQAQKQLKQDWKKISNGIIKTGAYAEAYLKVDNQEKKEKYEKKAKETVANLPDAFKNEAEAQSVTDESSSLGEDQNSETDNVLTSPEVTEVDNTSVQVEDVSVETTLETETLNPFASSNDEAEDSEKESNEDSSVSGVSSSEKAEDVEEDSELKDLKKEVQDELKKQEQNPNNVNPFAEYEKKKAKENKSVLGV